MLSKKMDEAWKRTCKVLFGDEVGDVAEFNCFLTSQLDKDSASLLSTVKVNQKDMRVFHPLLSGEIRLVKGGEIEKMRSWHAHIDTIKDIDSLSNEIREVVSYSAYEVFGNSSSVQDSDLVTDSSYVLNSYMVENSKYVYSSCWVRDGSSYVFGSAPAGTNLQFAIRTNLSGWSKRVFEAYDCVSSSDVYYSHLIKNCQDVMFCFFQTAKRFTIGNLQLEKQQYLKIKENLLEQMRDELRCKKMLPSLFELVNESGEKPVGFQIELPEENPSFDMVPIERGFKKTVEVLFGSSEGKGLEAIKSHMPIYERASEYLLPKKGKNMFGYDVMKFDIGCLAHVPLNRVISEKMMGSFATLHLSLEEIESFSSIATHLGKIGFACSEMSTGTNKNIKDVPRVFNAYNALSVFDATDSHDQAYNLLSCPESNYTYFSSVVFKSSFVIGGFCSVDVKRALEVDRCVHSSDIYYCHNCDGCQNAMFSFHQKGKRNIIANLALPASEYATIRSHLLAQLFDEWKQGRLYISVLDLFSNPNP